MADTADVSLMIDRIKYLEKIIEDKLCVQEHDWVDVGAGTVYSCPICRASTESMFEADLKHRPDCYWAQKAEAEE